MTKTILQTQENSNENSGESRQERLGFWTTNVIAMPRFSTNQLVRFVGGLGTIIGCRRDSGTWSYAVEMEMGPEPDMGRVGNETMILLHEADIQEAMSCPLFQCSTPEVKVPSHCLQYA